MFLHPGQNPNGWAHVHPCLVPLQSASHASIRYRRSIGCLDGSMNTNLQQQLLFEPIHGLVVFLGNAPMPAWVHPRPALVVPFHFGLEWFGRRQKETSRRCMLLARATARGVSCFRSRQSVRPFVIGRDASRRMARGAAPSVGSVETTVRVTTYNVLSSKLCSPTYYCYNDPEHLDPDHRFQKLIRFLQSEVEKGTVLCLQEVSQEWAGPLHAWFQRHDYHVLISLYSSPFSGYMGSAICFPNNRFEARTMDIARVSDLKHWPNPPKKPFPERVVEAVLRRANAGLRRILRRKPKFDDWAYSKERMNRLLVAKLKCKETEQELCVATYHMPCAFYAPKVMNIHAALAAQRVQELAKTGSEDECEFIFCGDFNFKPGDAPYQMYIDGVLPEESSDYPHPPPWDDWKPTLAAPLRSAYREAHGKEPDFTNYARSARNSEPFIGTLDYIFLSRNVGILEMPKLPLRNEVDGPFPNETELSDHIKLQGTFSISRTKVQ